jgi:hypothetical protein
LCSLRQAGRSHRAIRSRSAELLKRARIEPRRLVDQPLRRLALRWRLKMVSTLWPFTRSPIQTLMPPSQKVSQPQLDLANVKCGDGFVEGHFCRRFIVAASCSLRSFNVACLSSNETRDRA